ncbi:MAG: hypothetical protein QXD02_04520 [Candidatus Parvarchaeum sp.]|jgi:hypothetical protein|nr:hypothetical protein [Candidatus Parvarchaeum tengchongense]MCW1295287.1 hypothetical protein [Candidatus Parvarchaeum tengchongense]MCW1299554.1 hypothetical protein [Candidatus Parvarchaeum tengchongense]
MEKVKEQVLEKIKKALDKTYRKEFSWDGLIEWMAYISALSDFGLLTKEEAQELADFVDENSI